MGQGSARRWGLGRFKRRGLVGVGMTDAITVEWADDRVRILLDRPDKRNAMTAAMFTGLYEAVTDAAAASPAVVTLRGAGGDFSAGVDMSNVPDRHTERPLAVRDDLEAAHAMLRAIESLEAPVLAAIDGYALGGGLELALACDIRVASPDALFGLPEADYGLAVDLGAGQKLPGMVGEGMAKYLAMTGETITAERALEIGLIETLAPAGGFEEAVADLEGTLAEKPTYVQGMAKRQIHGVRPATMDVGMETAVYHAISAYHEEETQRLVEGFFETSA